MANNGYLSGSSCVSIDQKSQDLCLSYSPNLSLYALFTTSSKYVYCEYSSSPAKYFYFSQPNCVILGPIPPSTIPTVQDGITLGWQAGGALILVGCILFLKKALK